jgi:hypothetical protein
MVGRSWGAPVTPPVAARVGTTVRARGHQPPAELLGSPEHLSGAVRKRFREHGGELEAAPAVAFFCRQSATILTM